jgi:26S proteasome regulatory subunit N2
MKVIAWSPNLTSERAQAADVGYVDIKAELFKQSDVVSIHMVLSDTTRHMITYKDLAMMKPTAFFINTSRGPLVDENALIKILKEERIAGAGLDVFDVEPLPLDHPIRSLKRVTLSPHTGYLTDSNYAVSIYPLDRLILLVSRILYERCFGDRRWKISSIFWMVNKRLSCSSCS